jgi:hypothetical protein
MILFMILLVGSGLRLKNYQKEIRFLKRNIELTRDDLNPYYGKAEN